jgi:hypothetical protein
VNLAIVLIFLGIAVAFLGWPSLGALLVVIGGAILILGAVR